MATAEGQPGVVPVAGSFRVDGGAEGLFRLARSGGSVLRFRVTFNAGFMAACMCRRNRRFCLSGGLLAGSCLGRSIFIMTSRMGAGFGLRRGIIKGFITTEIF